LAGALSVGERATISDECRGCGRCVGLCPEGAIEIRFEGADDFVASAVERLSARVDVT
jgi:ferredoxin